MPISQAEFDAMMEDAAKWIEGDLCWREDPDRSPAVEFRAEVQSEVGYPLWVNARFNRLAGTLSYTLVHRAYRPGICLGPWRGSSQSHLPEDRRETQASVDRTAR